MPPHPPFMYPSPFPVVHLLHGLKQLKRYKIRLFAWEDRVINIYVHYLILLFTR